MRIRSLRASALVALSTVATASSANGAAYAGSDLFTLARFGEFTAAIPTGYQPAGAGGVGGQLVKGDNFAHAAVFTGPGAAVDLNPAGYLNSYVYAANGSRQVGYATTGSNGTQGHAFLWSGTAASAVYLTPAGYATATAYGMSATQQVGSAAVTFGGNDHATLWNGTAASYLDINPAGTAVSRAYGTDGVHQVGSGSVSGSGLQEHALRWTNGAGAVDLHPTNITFAISTALATRGTRTGGFASTSAGGNRHGLLWTSDSPIAIDLTPAGAREALVFDVSESIEVGFVTLNNFESRAAMWSGSAGSFVDLGLLLPAGLSSSVADRVGADGTIYGYALDAGNQYHAVQWTPVPEPTAFASLAALAVFAIRRRRGA